MSLFEIEDGNVISIWLSSGILWFGRIVTLYYVVPCMTVVTVGTTVKETMLPAVN